MSCPCCHPLAPAKSGTPLPAIQEIAFLSPAAAAEEALYREECAAHEAGHVIGYALFGIECLHAQVGERPHVLPRRTPGDSLLETVLPIFAGQVAGGFSRKHVVGLAADVIEAKITAGDGSAACDFCKVGACLATSTITTLPEQVEAWRLLWATTIDCIISPSVWPEVAKLARALSERTLLESHDIASIIDGPRLRSIGARLHG